MLSITIIVSLIFITSILLRLIYRSDSAILNLDYLFLSGVEMVLVGILLSPQNFSLLPVSIFTLAKFIIMLCLGWMSIVFGIRFQYVSLKRYKSINYSHIFLFTLLPLTVISLFAILLPEKLLGRMQSPLWFGIIIGSACSLNTFSTFQYFRKKNTSPPEELAPLFFISGLDQVILLFIYSVAITMIVKDHPIYIGILVVTGTALFCGVLFNVFTRIGLTDEELSVVFASILLLCVGVPLYFNSSVILTCFICGIFIGRTCNQRKKILELLIEHEHTIYLLCMFLMGTFVVFDSVYPILGGVILLIVRNIVKISINSWWTPLQEELEFIENDRFAHLVHHPVFAFAFAFETGVITNNQSIVTAIFTLLIINELITPILVHFMVIKRSSYDKS